MATPYHPSASATSASGSSSSSASTSVGSKRHVRRRSDGFDYLAAGDGSSAPASGGGIQSTAAAPSAVMSAAVAAVVAVGPSSAASAPSSAGNAAAGAGGSPGRMPRSVSDHVSLASHAVGGLYSAQYLERSPSMVWNGVGSEVAIPIGLVGGQGGGGNGNTSNNSSIGNSGNSSSSGSGGGGGGNGVKALVGRALLLLLRPFRCFVRPRALSVLALAALRLAMAVRHGAASASLDDVVYALKPADRWVLLYLVATLPIALIGETVLWSSMFARLALVCAICGWRLFAASAPAPGLFWSWRGVTLAELAHASPSGLVRAAFGHWVALIFLEWYPIILFPLFYSEAGTLIRSLYGDARYDLLMINFEESVYGGQPAQRLRELLPFPRLLGEYFFLCYFLYYLILFLTPFALFVSRPREQFDRYFSAFTLAWVLTFLLYLLCPVEGPFWNFLPPDPSQYSFFMGRIVQSIVKGGSAKGTAFPSGHCGLSLVSWLGALTYHRRIGVFYAAIVPGLVVATVYCGFHYTIDLVFGLSLGFVTYWTAVHAARVMDYAKPAWAPYGDGSGAPVQLGSSTSSAVSAVDPDAPFDVEQPFVLLQDLSRTLLPWTLSFVRTSTGRGFLRSEVLDP
jgi:membrane-associated phospholipid phosphatase